MTTTPQQPWIASREEAMRLNALNLAVHTKDVVDIIGTAKKYFEYLVDEPHQEPKPPQNSPQTPWHFLWSGTGTRSSHGR
jgi:hypothetical protein